MIFQNSSVTNARISLLAVDDQADGDRLDAAGAQVPRHLLQSRGLSW